MPVREVRKTIAEVRKGDYGIRLNALSWLHRTEAKQGIINSRVVWDRGEVNPYGGGLFHADLIVKVKLLERELSEVISAIVGGLFSWYARRSQSRPTLLVERAGKTAEGEEVEYDIVCERTSDWGGRMLVKLPIKEKSSMVTDGYGYNLMGLSDQSVRFNDLSPILSEAVGHFGFETVSHSPTKDVGISIICIAPVEVGNRDQSPVRHMLEKALELGCSITLTLKGKDGLKRFFSKISLEKEGDSWKLTFSAVGGDEYWRDQQIRWFEENLPRLVPDKAQVVYYEKYEEEPSGQKKPVFKLPKVRVHLPNTRVGRATKRGLWAVSLPIYLILLIAALVIKYDGEFLAWVAKTMRQLASRFWSWITGPIRRWIEAERARKEELAELFSDLGLKPQKEHLETCFLAVSGAVEKDPVAVRAMVQESSDSDEEGGSK